MVSKYALHLWQKGKPRFVCWELCSSMSPAIRGKDFQTDWEKNFKIHLRVKQVLLHSPSKLLRWLMVCTWSQKESVLYSCRKIFPLRSAVLFYLEYLKRFKGITDSVFNGCFMLLCMWLFSLVWITFALMWWCLFTHRSRERSPPCSSDNTSGDFFPAITAK